jgi:hypothetical protein
MSDPDTLIGQSIDHYQITRHLARGGMADVYLSPYYIDETEAPSRRFHPRRCFEG